MRQFIPFEDDWAALEALRPGELIPCRVGLLPERSSDNQRTFPISPSIVSTSPATTPTRRAVPAASSNT